MGSPSTQEWLELSLGLRGTKKNKQQKEEKEDEKRSRLCQKKLVVCGTTSNEEGEDGNLDLRLQIGPNKSNYYYNMGIMDFMLQHQSKKKHLHSDYSITNSAGLWFSLLSSPNRKGEAALPQIPKPYIRVKDEKMTVLMVKKYLVTKLGLSNQAEVELWCMGERLLQTQSLKQVRDGIWLPKLVEFVNSNSSLSTSSILFHHQNQTPFSSSNTYLMSLHYGRTCFF